MSKKTLNIAGWLMLAVFPISSLAGDAIGMLSAKGTVLVDHHPAALGGAVFAGNTIETKDKSQAVVTARGSVISMAENSSVQLGPQEVELQSGAVVVTSSRGIVTRVQNAVIRTSPGGPSKFVARRWNGQLQLLAMEGTVYVTDGRESQTVTQNQGVSVALDLDDQQEGRRQNPPTATQGPRLPRPRIGWLHNDDLGTLIVIAAAIAAGVALGIYNSVSASPAAP